MKKAEEVEKSHATDFFRPLILLLVFLLRLTLFDYPFHFKEIENAGHFITIQVIKLVTRSLCIHSLSRQPGCMLRALRAMFTDMLIHCSMSKHKVTQ